MKKSLINIKFIITILLILFMGQIYFSGCGINSMIARQTVDHLHLAVPVFERESDLILAESAIAGQIKLVEAFDERYP